MHMIRLMQRMKSELTPYCDRGGLFPGCYVLLALDNHGNGCSFLLTSVTIWIRNPGARRDNFIIV